MPIEFHTAVVCDEVRQEVSGKSVIVGAAPVGPVIRKGQVTKVDRLGIYLDVTVSGIVDVRIRLIREGETDALIQTQTTFPEPPGEEDGTAVGAMVFGREGFEVEQGGIYWVEYSADGGDWVKIRSVLFPEIDSDSEE